MSDALRTAAQAVIDRWSRPAWQWASHGPTADLIHALRTALAQPVQPAVAGEMRPAQLTEDESRSLEKFSQAVFADLLENELGGYSGVNRPFWLQHQFRQVIEQYGYRDTALSHSSDALKEAYQRGQKDATIAQPEQPAPLPVPRVVTDEDAITALGVYYDQTNPRLHSELLAKRMRSALEAHETRKATQPAQPANTKQKTL